MNSIEQSLFSWGTVQAAESSNLEFHDVTLKVPIGDHKVGAKFDKAVILWELSKLQLTRYDENGGSDRWDYRISLAVGDFLTRVSDPFGNSDAPPVKIGAKVEETLEDEEESEWGEHTRREV